MLGYYNGAANCHDKTARRGGTEAASAARCIKGEQTMKPPCVLLIMLWITVAAQAAEKPRLFIASAANSREIEFLKFPTERIIFTDDLEFQELEVAKTFAKRCPAVVVTVDIRRAKYFVVFHHKGGRKLLRKDNRITIFNRDGDLIHASSTRTLGNAVKNACKAILRQTTLKK